MDKPEKKIYKNKYGLTRTIPEDVKRQIRQECGFGCVHCGNAITEYEHIDPPFVEATKHEASKMALLCGTCHSKVTRGYLSKKTILQDRANPKTFKEGISKDVLDIDEPFSLEIGSNSFNHVSTFIKIKNKNLVYIEPPEEEGAPARLTAYFYNQGGEPVLTIYKNELWISTENWDTQAEGGKFIVRNGQRDIILEFKVEPPHKIIITKLNMSYKGVHVKIENKDLMFRQNDGSGYIILADIYTSGNGCAVNIG